MLVHARINYVKALQVTGKKFIFFLFTAILINLLVFKFHWQHALISERLIMLLASAIGVFLAFRINAAYTRWKDGYSLFRDLTTTGLSLISQIIILNKDTPNNYGDLVAFKRKIGGLIIVYATLVRLELTEPTEENFKHLVYERTIADQAILSQDEITLIKTKKRKAFYVLTLISDAIHAFSQTHSQNIYTTGELAKTLQQLYLLEQMMFSLKNTPFPWGYQFYTRLFVWILAILFMFTTLNESSLLDNMVIAFTSTVFVTIEQVARNLDNPIACSFNGAPLQSNCQILEISMLEALDIPHNLDFLMPEKGILR